MTWTRPIYLHYDDRKYDRLFSIGKKIIVSYTYRINININVPIQKSNYLFEKIKLIHIIINSTGNHNLRFHHYLWVRKIKPFLE